MSVKVGVIGAGVMGSGVAQSAAQAGHEVVVVDLQAEVLEKSKASIYQNVRFAGFYQKDKQLEPVDVVMPRLTFTTDYSLLADADIIVENVPEVWEIKRDCYVKMNEICNEETVFLVNTSCISITKIGSLMKRPDKVIGVHFMNPVPMKPTVESIKGWHTSEETIQFTNDFLGSMEKKAIMVNDLPGFVSNRLSHLLMNEAAYVVQDQVADPKSVDDIFKECFGHKMGPLETADLIGLDTVVQSLDILYESYQDPKFRVCPLLRKMVEAGLHGRKSGQGFYSY
ncbi:3-hydroxybutyryl-CoA dehydrogenase [Tumebacillus algifaecis]|uniref:3-hydroxybutyryl-CoA dehydrogenase n=1 Tax=Tumebacillus algifaecis TaxID=1214604 RepID=A0A223D7C2_9BACL|nr:3-hydroxyacyl-CoA dehydrogenase family protein [Tumebacillus algifaecis]ASS77264.1 3-hydroxybutyryl-CoA dehydrogenase [Tumebacillus algifaecis]